MSDGEPGKRETVRGSRTLVTPHPPERYPGFLSVTCGSETPINLVVGEPGHTLAAMGGEECYAYETEGGVKAEGFRLNAGDRATVRTWDLPAFLAEWEIERA